MCMCVCIFMCMCACECVRIGCDHGIFKIAVFLVEYYLQNYTSKLLIWFSLGVCVSTCARACVHACVLVRMCMSVCMC